MLLLTKEWLDEIRSRQNEKRIVVLIRIAQTNKITAGWLEKRNFLLS